MSRSLCKYKIRKFLFMDNRLCGVNPHLQKDYITRIQSQVNSIEILRELQRGRLEKVERCTGFDYLKALDTEIRLLNGRINTANSKMDQKAREVLHKSEKFCLKENDIYHQKLATLNEAIALAKEEDIDALEKLYINEMANFFSQWSDNKLFNDDYEKRVLESLESHGLSTDGRNKNLDETGSTSQ